MPTVHGSGIYQGKFRIRDHLEQARIDYHLTGYRLGSDHTQSGRAVQRSLSGRARDSLRQQEEHLNIEEAELSHAGVHSPTRSTSIQDRRAKVRSEKRRLGRDISERAVTVRWLTQWCDKYDLWKVPTWQVVDDVIKVLTAQRRCRFVDLDEEVHDDEMGTVDVFISHCWTSLLQRSTIPGRTERCDRG